MKNFLTSKINAWTSKPSIKPPSFLNAKEILYNKAFTLYSVNKESFDQLVRQSSNQSDLVDMKDPDGNPFLHVAIRKAWPGSVSRILEGGASIEARNSRDETALHVAVTYGDQKIIALLLQRKPDIEAKDEHGKTPLHQAAYQGHSKVVKQLLDLGASVDARDKANRTPMHWSCASGKIRVWGHEDGIHSCYDGIDEKVITVLMQHGADANLLDINNDTPRDLAASDSNKIRALENAMLYRKPIV